VLPKDFNANQPKTIRLYPLSNYTFGTKDGQPEEDPSVLARLKRLEEHYQEHGMRRTCEGILVCHEHNHPHILMLQIANAFFKLCASLDIYINCSDTFQTGRLPPRRRRRD
jgi:cleavage and polyadenylation specificity factor subunit 5